jgi:hypothetical protein
VIVAPVPHVTHIWHSDSVWRWACSCGRAGASTAETGAHIAAEQHAHNVRRAPRRIR